jgi:hypothetical protein
MAKARDKIGWVVERSDSLEVGGKWLKRDESGSDEDEAW